MSNEVKTEYLKSIREEYKKASRREKSAILRHAMLVTGLSRKRLIRLLNHRGGIPASRPRGRKPRYEIPGLLEHLKLLWLTMEQPCGKRLQALLPHVLGAYRKRYSDLSEEQARALLAMSPASLDRRLKLFRIQRGVGTTRAPSSAWYRSAIPVVPKDWNVTAPGYVQADTVSHCGESASGSFANTLTVTDLDSHWTEMRAMYTKQHLGIIRALRDIEQRLPFRLHTIKFDSGSEFMNFEVISFCRAQGPGYRPKPLQVLRSRPYRKNDQCYVEQKNLTHVRQFVGYDRIESDEAAKMLNALYRDLWGPFVNFFLPTFKLIRKERMGSRIKKTYEKPRTPYERLLASRALSDEQKQTLRERYESLDPFELKERIEQALQALYQRIREEQKPDALLKLTA